VLRTIKRWQAGQLKNVPSSENQAAIARMVGTARSAYFPVGSTAAVPPHKA